MNILSTILPVDYIRDNFDDGLMMYCVRTTGNNIVIAY